MDSQRLDKNRQATLNNFISELRNAFQHNLISVILYGSGASGEFTSNYSNLNVLVVLASADIKSLQAVTGVVNKAAYRRIAPIFLSENFIAGSSDVFPIEFMDMQENHLLLFGKDVFEGLTIETKNLRFQCEQELKSKLLNIKNAYLKISNDKAALRNLLFKSFTSVLHILRNVLKVRGKAAPYQKIEILREVALEFHISIDAWKKILEAKSDALELSPKETDDLFVKFMGELEILTNIIDAL